MDRSPTRRRSARRLHGRPTVSWLRDSRAERRQLVIRERPTASCRLISWCCLKVLVTARLVRGGKSCGSVSPRLPPDRSAGGDVPAGVAGETCPPRFEDLPAPDSPGSRRREAARRGRRGGRAVQAEPIGQVQIGRCLGEPELRVLHPPPARDVVGDTAGRSRSSSAD